MLLSDIKKMPTLRSLDENEPRFKDYVAFIKEHPDYEADPIIVAGGKVLDGLRRVSAYRLAGRTTIESRSVG